MSTAMEVADKPEKDDKRIITPYAFTISSELLGLKLARPWRRGLAMLIDLTVVAFLSTLNAYLMLLVAGWILWRMVSDQRFSRRSRIALRVLAGCTMVLSLTVGVFDYYLDEDAEVTQEVAKAKSVMELTLSAGKAAMCDELDCWEDKISDVGELVAMQTSDPAEAEKVIREFLSDAEIGKEHKSGLAKRIAEAWALAARAAEEERLAAAEEALLSEAEATEDVTDDMTDDAVHIDLFEDEPGSWSPEANSPLSWLKGVIEELGLGFGWAACYFTLFTAWWHGQTPGKKLLRIRVLQLDNTSLSLWDAFGRYGGYGAGLATGLLGFFQIYWDPNRQAIQDKISSTVVIYGKQAKS
ncbi:RDD family protein [Corallincola platygyrae]|uniref:RDD family protein n=1 Tax=Corallincola platygyrae TaxID=1193278 RepID=A0ABW4XIQ7_9GAMM